MPEAPALRLQSAFGFKVWRYERTTRLTMSAHVHADIEINYLRAGWIRYFHGGRFYEIPKGCLGVFWAGIPHQLTAHSPRFEGVWITFPVHWLLGWQIPGSFQAALLAGELDVTRDTDPESGADEQRLASWLRAYEEGGAEQRKIVTLELEARLRRMAAARPAPGRKVRGGPGDGSTWQKHRRQPSPNAHGWQVNPWLAGQQFQER